MFILLMRRDGSVVLLVVKFKLEMHRDVCISSSSRKCK